MSSISELALALASGRNSSSALIAEALAKIDAPGGEGRRVFTRVYRNESIAAAAASDSMRQYAGPLSVIAGLPISIKDLFDVAGETTLAGSVARRLEAPAVIDAPVVSRLRQAGAILVGKTNMSEFAFSGLGLNPHYGTPKNPWDRHLGRIPGGSTSGGAVSVADGMAVASIGTDTGGSVRIPAAFCGLVGFKPTAARIPRAGVFPLSQTLDSVGPIARTVSCCAVLDSLMSGGDGIVPAALPLRGLRLGVVQEYVQDQLEAPVADAFHRALQTLSAAGARVMEVSMPQLYRLPEINQQGGIVAAEAYTIHKRLLALREAQYDQRIVARILRGREMGAADYLEVLQARVAVRAELEQIAQDYDALLLPTVAILPPALAPLERDDTLFARTNALVLRNTSVANFMDGCAISIPCHRPGDGPVGLMLMGIGGSDSHLLRTALSVEKVLQQGAHIEQ